MIRRKTLPAVALAAAAPAFGQARPSVREARLALPPGRIAQAEEVSS